MEPDRFNDPFLYPLFANLAAIAVPITVRPACSINGFDKDNAISPLCLSGMKSDLVVTLHLKAPAAQGSRMVGILLLADNDGGRNNARHELVMKSTNTTSNFAIG